MVLNTPWKLKNNLLQVLWCHLTYSDCWDVPTHGQIRITLIIRSQKVTGTKISCFQIFLKNPRLPKKVTGSYFEDTKKLPLRYTGSKFSPLEDPMILPGLLNCWQLLGQGPMRLHEVWLPESSVQNMREESTEGKQTNWPISYMDVSENSGTPKSSILIGFPL